MSIAAFLSKVTLRDSAGDPYRFGFELGSLANDEGETVYDCECCPAHLHTPAYYRAADDTFWCVQHWKVRQSMHNPSQGW